MQIDKDYHLFCLLSCTLFTLVPLSVTASCRHKVSILYCHFSSINLVLFMLNESEKKRYFSEILDILLSLNSDMAEYTYENITK